MEAGATRKMRHQPVQSDSIRPRVKDKLTLFAPENGWPAVVAWAKIIRLRGHLVIAAIRWAVEGRSPHVQPRPCSSTLIRVPGE